MCWVVFVGRRFCLDNIVGFNFVLFYLACGEKIRLIWDFFNSVVRARGGRIYLF